MTIKELEKELGVPRATIRFYEKQEMIHPLRRGNEYRDYSPEDVILLKRIIILRKLGFSIVEVKAILSGKVSLTTAAEAQKKKLQEQVKDLNGAILICQEMEAENEDIQSFDESYYWNEIQEKEKDGYRFIDLELAISQMAGQIEYTPGHGPIVPDLVWNPLQKQEKKVRSFWQKHAIVQLILALTIILASIILVIFINNRYVRAKCWSRYLN